MATTSLERDYANFEAKLYKSSRRSKNGMSSVRHSKPQTHNFRWSQSTHMLWCCQNKERPGPCRTPWGRAKCVLHTTFTKSSHP